MRSLLLAVIGAAVLFMPAFADELPIEKKSDANISGHIINTATGEHIPNIIVEIKGTTIAVMADNTGHFFLKNLPVGEFTLLASGLGYKSVEKKVTTTKGRTIEVNFDMDEESIDIDQVVVSANRNETNKKTSATIVNVLSGKQFERTSSNTIAESLNFGTGLRVEYNCSNCGVPQLRINGLDGQYSQILLDSRPIFSSLAAVYGLEQLPTAMVERMEVIRGGGSALFGSNAIGGVVNIITKEPLRNSLSISNTTGILKSGTTDINTSLNGSFVSDDNKAGIYLFGMIRDREAYDRDDDGYSEIPKLESETIGFRGYYKTGIYSKITAEYHHIREFRRGGNKMDRPPHEADIAEQLRHKINGGGIKFDAFSPNERHRFSIHASTQFIDRDSYFGTRQNLDAYGASYDKTYVGGGQYSYKFNKLLFSEAELTAGAEFTGNDLNDKMLGYNRIINQHTRTIGGYLQNEWKGEKLNVLIGARLDKHNLINKAIISPRANVRYSPNEHIGLRASYSSGYRAPQAYNEDLHVAAVGGEVSIIQLAKGLKPEYSHSFSASADLYKAFGNFQTNLLIEAFYTDLRDVFVLEDIGRDDQNNIILERRNGKGATVKGVNLEAILGYKGKAELQLGYTFQRSRYKEPEQWSEDPAVAPQTEMFRTPDNYGYLSANVFITPKFKTSVFGTYTGTMFVPHMKGYVDNDRVEKTPDFFDMGLKLSYTFNLKGSTQIELSGGVKNALDQFQKDLDRGMLRDAGYIYGPAMPRTIFFGAKFSL